MIVTDPTAAIRRTAYLFLSAVAVAVMVAKIVGAENVFEPSRYAPPAGGFGAGRIDAPSRKWPAERPDPSPMFGSNDRSRWATVEALVHNGTYVVGKRERFTEPGTPPGAPKKKFGDKGIIFDPKTERILTLDVVMNPATGEFYSSKPPLLATLVAGEYWLLHNVAGWDIDRERWPVVCVVLLTVNVLPFVLFLVLLAKLVERYGTTDFGKLFTFAVGALGTFLLTFSNTLNNHTPAAYCVLFAVYPVLSDRTGKGSFLLAGLAAGFAVCLDLPSAAFAAGLGVVLLFTRWKLALVFGVGAVIPVAAQFACNYAALGTLTPAYAEFGGPWYNYADSHWKRWELVKAGQYVPGLDFNQEPTHVYAFHLLFGHHGWFSLTPAFLLGAVGMCGSLRSGSREGVALLRRSPPAERGTGSEPLLSFPLFVLLTAAVSAVVFAFYLTRTQSYNYGGNTSGPRWLFWLIPLWLVCGLPAADRLGRRKWGGAVAALLLGFSALSAFYPAWNPWRSPWIMQAGERLHLWNYEAERK